VRILDADGEPCFLSSIESFLFLLIHDDFDLIHNFSVRSLEKGQALLPRNKVLGHSVFRIAHHLFGMVLGLNQTQAVVDSEPQDRMDLVCLLLDLVVFAVEEGDRTSCMIASIFAIDSQVFTIDFLDQELGCFDDGGFVKFDHDCFNIRWLT